MLYRPWRRHLRAIKSLRGSFLPWQESGKQGGDNDLERFSMPSRLGTFWRLPFLVQEFAIEAHRSPARRACAKSWTRLRNPLPELAEFLSLPALTGSIGSTWAHLDPAGRSFRSILYGINELRQTPRGKHLRQPFCSAGLQNSSFLAIRRSRNNNS
jgi:hypothetical protein